MSKRKENKKENNNKKFVGFWIEKDLKNRLIEYGNSHTPQLNLSQSIIKKIINNEIIATIAKKLRNEDILDEYWDIFTIKEKNMIQNILKYY